MMNTELNTILDTLEGVPRLNGQLVYDDGEPILNDNARKLADLALRSVFVPVLAFNLLKDYLIYCVNAPVNWESALNENVIRNAIFKIWAMDDAIQMIEFVSKQSYSPREAE